MNYKLVIFFVFLIASIIILGSFSRKLDQPIKNTSTLKGTHILQPCVYEIHYNKRDIKDPNIWLLSKTAADNSQFADDILKQRVNYVIANGRMYKVAFKYQTSENIAIQFDDACNDDGSMFFKCKRTATAPSQKILHVLGYLGDQ